VSARGAKRDLPHELRWVKAARDTDLSFFPDFLIIGPQRTGTTWLGSHLRFHPEIFLTRADELFFWSSLKSRDPRRFVSDDVGWYVQQFRDPWWQLAARTARCLWKHGERYQPRVRGERTASYAVIDPDVIADIVTLNPEIKAILLIRNPVDRAWSHAKKDLMRKRGTRLEDVSEEDLRGFFIDAYQLRCARSVEQYDNWASHLKPGHLLTVLFDDIVARPETVLLDVMRFLGVRSDPRYIDRNVRSPVNPTESLGMPDRHRRFLTELFQDDLRKLKERFGLSWS
jgi:hypothetical protein